MQEIVGHTPPALTDELTIARQKLCAGCPYTSIANPDKPCTNGVAADVIIDLVNEKQPCTTKNVAIRLRDSATSSLANSRTRPYNHA